MGEGYLHRNKFEPAYAGEHHCKATPPSPTTELQTERRCQESPAAVESEQPSGGRRSDSVATICGESAFFWQLGLW